MIEGKLAVIVALAFTVLFAPIDAQAQPSKRVYRIGLLDYGAVTAVRQNDWNAFRQQLRELGYVEGQNVSFESRSANGENDRLPKLAAELVGLKVDVIVTGATNATIAAKRVTSTIPIVTAVGSDPVALGLVATLRQPGGNVTGMTSVSSDLAAKRLEFIRLVVPGVSNVAILWDEGNPASRLAMQETEVAAKTLGLTLNSVPVRSPADFEAAFSAMVRDRAAALSITTSPMFSPPLKAAGRAGDKTPAPDRRRRSRDGRSGLPSRLWHRLSESLPRRGNVCRQDPQGCQAR
jgi:putative tryptophan/tyrosine transport system substrate-binding protein